MSGSRSLSTEGLLYLGLHAIGKVEEGQVTTDQLISQTFKVGGGISYVRRSRCTVYFVSQMPREFNDHTLPYSYRYCSLLNVIKLQV